MANQGCALGAARPVATGAIVTGLVEWWPKKSPIVRLMA